MTQAHSLDVPLAEDGPSLGDRLAVEDDALDLVEQRGMLRQLINELPERERTILLMRFYGEQTQTCIAEQVGVSQMHVSRLLSRTIEHLRSRMDADDPDGGGSLLEDRLASAEDD
ncbi:MAG: sigma-70 family RNA polymerase sigma factor [Pseudonocardia sp.]|nr:sigma-70 family RNA polymerase sigma factor [Pseudonocardia sp.]